MLAFLFAALAGVGLFSGAAITGLSVAQAAYRLRWPEDYMSSFTIGHLLNTASPGLWLMLGSLLMLAIGHGLRRLDQIAANTANAAANTAHLVEDQ